MATLAALSLVCGLLTLTRAEQILLFPALVVPLVIGCRGLGVRKAVAWLGVAAAALVMVLTPWIVYNRDRFAEPVLLTTTLGSNIGLSNNHTTYSGPWLGSLDFAQWSDPRRLLVAAGGRIGRRRPGPRTRPRLRGAHLTRVPVVLLARQARTWSVFNVGQQAALDQSAGHDSIWLFRGATLAYWVLLIAAVGGVIALRRMRTLLFPLLVPFGIVVVATTLTYGSTRYRASAEVSLVLLAAVGVTALIERRRRVEREGPQPPNPVRGD